MTSGRGGIDGHEIVVVQVDAPRAQFGKTLGDAHGIESGPDEIAEWIAAAVAHGPQPVAELVCWRRREACDVSHLIARLASIATRRVRLV